MHGVECVDGICLGVFWCEVEGLAEFCLFGALEMM